MTSESQGAGSAIHLKHGNIVATLIAAVEEPTGRIKVEAARVIPSCPLFPNERQTTVWPNRKDPNTVVQAVARIDELPIG